MNPIWCEMRSMVVAAGLLFGAGGIARADAVSNPAPDLPIWIFILVGHAHENFA